jgi:hypothetical protein
MNFLIEVLRNVSEVELDDPFSDLNVHRILVRIFQIRRLEIVPRAALKVVFLEFDQLQFPKLDSLS